MEEQFESKTNKKMWKIIVPIVLIIAILVGVIIYSAIAKSPKNIFLKAVDAAFKTTELEDYNSVKAKVELSGSIESDDYEVQEVNDIISALKLIASVEMDQEKEIFKGNVVVENDGESLVNADAILQDNTMYLYSMDFFDKYLMIPDEYMEESGVEISEIFNSAEELDIDSKTINKELKEAIKKELKTKEFTQEKVEIELDGENKKVTKSTLSLTDEEFVEAIKNITEDLSKNEKFLKAFGEENKDEIKDLLDELVDVLDEAVDSLSGELTIDISIYTKGITQSFAKFDIAMYSKEEKACMGIEVVKENKEEYTIRALYSETTAKLEKAEEVMTIEIKNEKENKNKGKLTAKLKVIDNIASATLELDYEKNKGDLKLKVSADDTTVNINLKYEVEYDAKVTKVDVGNSVSIDDLTDEDNETMENNLENSNLYKFMEDNGLIEEEVIEPATQTTQTTDNMTISSYGKSVKYSVPAGFTPSSYNSESYKYYSNSNFDSVSLSIRWQTADEYMESLEDSYILETDLYTNQKVSDVQEVTVGTNTFKTRKITYTYEGYTNVNYVDTYYCYSLGSDYCLTIEVKSKEGQLDSADKIKEFLTIQVL